MLKIRDCGRIDYRDVKTTDEQKDNCLMANVHAKGAKHEHPEYIQTNTDQPNAETYNNETVEDREESTYPEEGR